MAYPTRHSTERMQTRIVPHLTYQDAHALLTELGRTIPDGLRYVRMSWDGKDFELCMAPDGAICTVVVLGEAS